MRCCRIWKNKGTPPINPMTLTINQTSAITFYQENLSYVEGFGLTNLDREDRILFSKGKKLIEYALNLKKTIRAEYTDTEVEFLCQTYVSSGSDMKLTQSQFFKKFPQTSHSQSSVWMKISRIRTLDSLFDNDTEWQIDNQIYNICQRIDSNRFSV